MEGTEDAPKRCLVSAEASCQEEVQRKNVGEEEEEVEESRERQMKNAIAEEVFAGMIKKANVPEGEQLSGVRQHWNCSQIEHRDEE